MGRGRKSAERKSSYCFDKYRNPSRESGIFLFDRIPHIFSLSDQKNIGSKLALYPMPITVIGAMNGDKPTYGIGAGSIVRQI